MSSREKQLSGNQSQVKELYYLGYPICWFASYFSNWAANTLDLYSASFPKEGVCWLLLPWFVGTWEETGDAAECGKGQERRLS